MLPGSGLGVTETDQTEVPNGTSNKAPHDMPRKKRRVNRVLYCSYRKAFSASEFLEDIRVLAKIPREVLVL